jgi:predicted transcriptional regulator of viral defense system
VDRRLRLLFPNPDDHGAALRLLEAMYAKPDRARLAMDLVRAAEVSPMTGLVILARLTNAGLIDHPTPGRYQVRPHAIGRTG